MKKKTIISLVFVFSLFTFFLVFQLPILAQTPTPDPNASPTPTPTPTPGSNNSGKLDSLKNEIAELQKKVTEFQNQGKTLSSQISVMDNQIKLTQLRIDATKQELQDLEEDIATASKKIDKLEISLKDITKVLLNRIVKTYEVGKITPLQIFASSNTATDFFSRANYLKMAQEHDKKLLYETQQAKNDYANQKAIFEAKKQKVVALKDQLEKYTAQLDQEKKGKQALLSVTQNNEAIYQQKLRTALAEQAAMQAVMSGGGNAVAAGPVKEGDVLGYMIIGRSACSSGTHLHFEVQRNGGTQNPADHLSNKSIIFDNSPDSSFSFNGGLPWPLNDPVRLTQGYGMTYWARNGWYGGGIHSGVDIVSDSSMAVKAVKEGQLYRGGIACGGGTLLFSRIDHADSLQTFYFHIVQ